MSAIRSATGAAIAALVICGPARAQEYGVSVISGFASRHDAAGYNERNHGFGIRADRGTLAGWSAGYYRNSIGRDSYYVAREWQWHVAGPVHVGAMAGGLTGYRYAVTPFVAPELVLRFDRLEVAVLYLPRIANVTPQLWAAQLRWRF